MCSIAGATIDDALAKHVGSTEQPVTAAQVRKRRCANFEVRLPTAIGRQRFVQTLCGGLCGDLHTDSHDEV